MFANKFFLLFINFLWMGGLFGVLFALLYMAQYRRRYFWNRGHMAQAPRTLAPLYGSLVLFVSGLALYSYARIGVVGQLVGFSLTGIWTLLALFFGYHWIELLIDGMQEGWDTPFEAGDDPSGGSGLTLGAALVLTLLVVNIGLLSWWGTDQVRAGALDFTQLITLNRQSPGATPGNVNNQAPSQPVAQPQASGGQQAPLTSARPAGANPSSTTTFTDSVTAWFTNAGATVMAVGSTAGQQVTAFFAPWFGGASGTAVPSPALALTPFAANGTPESTNSTENSALPIAMNARTKLALTLPATVTLPISTPATAMATPSPTVTPTVTPTITPTMTPTTPPTPTATATETSTPTTTPTPEPTATATATATPPPTATPRPSPTPTLVAGVITPLTPLDNEASSQTLRFVWSANFTPSPGYAFEVVFWRNQQEPLQQSLGMAAPTLETSVNVNLSELDNRLGDRLEPGTYQWGVLLVRTNPNYERLRYLGGGWHFTYHR